MVPLSRGSLKWIQTNRWWSASGVKSSQTRSEFINIWIYQTVTFSSLLFSLFLNASWSNFAPNFAWANNLNCSAGKMVTAKIIELFTHRWIQFKFQELGEISNSRFKLYTCSVATNNTFLQCQKCQCHNPVTYRECTVKCNIKHNLGKGWCHRKFPQLYDATAAMLHMATQQHSHV